MSAGSSDSILLVAMMTYVRREKKGWAPFRIFLPTGIDGRATQLMKEEAAGKVRKKGWT